MHCTLDTAPCQRITQCGGSFHRDLSDYPSITAVCVQDDLLYAELTVYETLYFAALLRLPQSWTRERKLQRVDIVIAALGLSKCRDTMIGGYMTRGVSGTASSVSVR